MEEESKKTNIKRIIKIVAIVILLSLILTVIILYRENRIVQNFFDEQIFKKVTVEDNWKQIDIANDSSTYICAYNRNIGILNNNRLKVYNVYGNEDFNLDVEISSPVFASSGKYLVIAEKNGNRVYLISDKNIAWQANVEGKIERVSIGENGYVAVSVTQTSYKAIVVVFNVQGREICKTYLSNTYGVDVTLSKDGKRLAIAEANLSGIQIKSNIRIIDLNKVEQGEENSVIYNKEIATNSAIIGIKYDSSNDLIVMLDDKIIKIVKDEEKELLKFEENTLFADIDLNNKIVQVVATPSEETQAAIKIKDNNNEGVREYLINLVPKELKTKGNTIVINTGNEVYVINSNGFLKTRYQTTQEIKEIVLSDKIIGIVYKNKIEIIN